ncbi:hypothetical protein, variant [Sphaeroforma arctica JP610]|uniref:HEAT repeat-containing protein 1 n=1 Tax=Sphaeroforma arctica JP610 TaxID=667725 RepID=A0A0L0FLF2_9EUKA|nr:hypothetical protein, variant [Sphaeroforma arctica JP610]KNC77607.1 hypothetical protein, variant [Sphaeroforma arctica JP610]|eukprot:XP_014151509.1 hypothetical protein, variant [Sphaeroforma arctica JP610]
MSTSLQKQLQKIAGSATAVHRSASKKQVSFLYDNTNDIVNTDLETIYAMALNGLAELNTYDNAFAEFERTLFSQKGKGMERLQLTNDEHDTLNKQIEDFLSLLTPYFLQRAAHKPLEYLIRKFRIHVHNVGAILSSIVLYHETAAFVRMVRILDLQTTKNGSRNWCWLETVQKEKRPLSKQAWVAECTRDPSLLLVVGEIAQNTTSSKLNRDTAAVSFWAASVVSVIDSAPAVNEAFLGPMLQQVVAAIESSNANYNAAGCIVLSALSSRVSIAAKPLQMLLKTIGKSITAVNYKTSVICIAYICRSQNVQSLPTAVVEKVVALDQHVNEQGGSVVSLFGNQLKNGGETFLLLLISRLAGKISLGEGDCDMQSLVHTLHRLISLVKMPTEVSAHVTTLILQRAVDLLRIEGVVTNILSQVMVEREVEVKLQPTVKLLATKYPTQMDAAINLLLKNADPAAFRFISKCFAGSRHQPMQLSAEEPNTTNGETNPDESTKIEYGSLLTCLEHPQAVIRLQTVNYLRTMDKRVITESEQHHLIRALSNRIEDEDTKVVIGALEALAFLLKLRFNHGVKKQSHKSHKPSKNGVVVATEDPAELAAKEQMIVDLRESLLRCVYSGANAVVVTKAADVLFFVYLGVYRKQLETVAPHALVCLFAHNDAHCAPAARVAKILTEGAILQKSPCFAGFTPAVFETFKSPTASTVHKNDAVIAALSATIKANPTLGVDLFTLCEQTRTSTDANAKAMHSKLRFILLLASGGSIPHLVTTSPKYVEKTLRFIEQELAVATNQNATNANVGKSKVKKIKATKLTKAVMSVLDRDSGAVPDYAVLQTILLCTLQRIITKTALGGNDEHAVMLLWRVFSLTASVDSRHMSDAVRTAGFQPLLIEIFTRIPAQAELLFLASSWLNESNTASNTNGVAVHVRALSIAHAFLQSLANMTQGSEKGTGPLLESVVVFVPSLLAVLVSETPVVRQLALKCFAAIDTIFTKSTEQKTMPDYPGTKDIQVSLGAINSTVVYQSLASTVFAHSGVTGLKGVYATQLVKEIVAHQLEFQNDAKYLATFASQGFTSALKEGQTKPKHVGKKYQESVALFITSYTCALKNPVQQSLLLSAVVALKNGALVLPSTIDLLHQLAQKCSSDTIDQSVWVGSKPWNKAGPKHRLTVAEVSVLEMLIKQFDTTVAPMLTIVDDLTRFLLDALKGFPGYTHGQMVAVRAITPEMFVEASADVQQDLVTTLCGVVQQRHNSNHCIVAARNALAHLPLDHTHFKTEIDRSEFVRLTNEHTSQMRDVAGGVAPQMGKRIRSDSESTAVANQNQADESVIPADNLLQLSTILEVLQAKTDVEGEYRLLADLFDVIGRCIDLQPISAGHFEVESVKQSALCAAVAVFTRTTDEAREQNDKATLAEIKKAVDVELIVRCVRMTENPQTHHHTLQLLAHIADVYPSIVLHNIMSIFTFMGDNVLRQDDNYSFHIIKQSIETVIPPLIRSTTFTNDPVKSKVLVLDIVKVFVGAYQHMPQHRRLRLFTHLLSTIGVSEYLGLVSVMMLDTHALTETNRAQQDAAGNHGNEENISVEAFVAQLIAQFDTKAQLSAFVVMTSFTCELPNHRPETSHEKTAWKRDHAIESTVCPLITRSDLQIAQFKGITVQVVANILGSRTFSMFSSQAMKERQQESDHMDEDEESLQDQYLRLLESILTLSRVVTEHMSHLSRQKGASKKHTPLTRAWKGCLDAAFLCMESVNNLLPLPMFVEVVKNLIRFDDTTVRCRALRLFALKVEEFKTLEVQTKDENELILEEPVRPHGDSQVDSAILFVGMVDHLVQLVADKHPSGDGIVQANVDGSSNTNSMKQSAMLNLEVLAHHFASKYPEPFVRALPVVISPAVLQSESLHLQASAMVCLGSLINALGTKVMSKLPVFLPLLLNTIQTQIDTRNTTDRSKAVFGPTSLLLVKSALVALSSCVAVLPQFISNRLSDILSIVTHEAFAKKDLSSEESFELSPASGTGAGDVTQKISDLRDQLAVVLAPRVILPALYAYYTNVNTAQLPAQTKAYRVMVCVRMLSSVVAGMSPSDMLVHYKSLFKLLLTAFEFSEGRAGEQDVVRNVWVDDASADAFVGMVMKLSETSFKPLFLTLVSWYTNTMKDSAKFLLRGQIFWRVLKRLSSTLKTIFAPYIKHLAAPMVSVLNMYNTSKSMPSEVRAQHEVVPAILHSLLSTLHNLFLFDSASPNTGSKRKGQKNKGGSISGEVFKEIHESVLHQLENDIGGLEATQQRNALLTEVIGQFAVTIADDDMWKTLNNKLLLMTRHHETSVRAAALTVEKELYSRLGEEFLLLLPETIPFLAEAMEDDSAEVESKAQEVISTIESFLGESLQKYF